MHAERCPFEGIETGVVGQDVVAENRYCDLAAARSHKLGEHQFMAIFEVDKLQPDRTKHFGLMVRDDKQIQEVRSKLIKKYKLKLVPGFRCDFRDPWGNRIQVGDLSDESLVWLLPYQEVQKTGLTFTKVRGKGTQS